MTNIKKIGLSALAGSLMAFSANAAELSVSAGASITFTDAGDDVSNNAWAMGDSIDFKASGETDGGLAISLYFELDNDNLDDTSVSISTDSMGTITFHGFDGSSALGAVDDVMPTAYEEPWSFVTSPSKIDGTSAANMFQYTSPSVGGATFTATYNQADTTSIVESQTSYAIAYSPEMVDGLTVGYAVQDDTATGVAAEAKDESTMYAKYTFGSITAGYQVSESDNATASEDQESTGMAISYAISDEMSISYGTHEVETPNDSADDDQKASLLSASYTSGGMSISASAGSVDNVGNVAATDKDTYEISMSFAF
jgi:outer membrane protein OmpU